MRKILSIASLSLAVVLIVAAAVLRWFVAPAAAVLPGDTDTTRTFTGTAASLLDPAALTGGTGQVLLTKMPITVVHRTKVLRSTAHNALVSDAKTVEVLSAPVAAVDYRYAVDRKNMGRGSGYGNVIAQKGLTFNWPIGTTRRDYSGWVADTGRTTNLQYTDTARRDGLTTYVFHTSTAAAPITDAQVLKALPRSMTKAQLVRVAGRLGLPAARLAALQQVLPSLPDPVPFAYTYRVDATYWVAPASGIVVDVRQHETRTVWRRTGS